MSERTITIPYEEYEELQSYRTAVLEGETTVFDRLVLTSNGESHEVRKIYTHEDFRKEAEDICEVLYSSGQVEEGSMQELFALRSKVNWLERYNQLECQRYATLRDTTVDKKEYDEVVTSNVELKRKLSNAVHPIWRTAALLLGAASCIRILLCI